MIHNQVLPNGLNIVVEPMPQARSVAYVLMFPGSILYDELGAQGASLILSELTTRGAGDLDSRALSAAFESIGFQHSEYAALGHYVYRGVGLPENLSEALQLSSKMVLAPHLPESEISPIKQLLLQDLNEINDNPSRKVASLLNRRYFPKPYNRAPEGVKEDIEGVEGAQLKELWERSFRANQAILSVAGNVQAEKVVSECQQCFGGMPSGGFDRIPFGSIHELDYQHEMHDSEQVQIAMSFPSASYLSPKFYTAKVAAAILSGGMFGRLFIEVREKQGLCYSVYARQIGNENYGRMFVYAGTTTDRAQKTLSVTLKTLREAYQNISAEELARAKTTIKANLVMGEESSSSRANGNGVDWWIQGKVRTLDEISAAIDSVSIDDIADYWKEFPMEPFMLQTLGANRLEI